MLESVGPEQHHGEEQEVVRGMHHDAGGERLGGEAHPAEYQADTDQQEEWSDGVGGLLSVHKGKWNACEDGGEDHGGDGPLRMAIVVERAGAVVGEAFGSPVARGGEGGKKEASEEDLLKKRRECDPEDEERPGRQSRLEELVDGSVGGAGQHDFIDQGEPEAEAGGSK